MFLAAMLYGTQLSMLLIHLYFIGTILLLATVGSTDLATMLLLETGFNILAKRVCHAKQNSKFILLTWCLPVTDLFAYSMMG